MRTIPSVYREVWLMSGHSKWCNTKHRKAVRDSRKSKIFTKIIRSLTSESRESGGRLDGNPRLRSLIELASQNNISKKVITRAVSRGGKNPPSRTKCGGFGPGRSAIVIEYLDGDTEKTARRMSDVLCRSGGRLCRYDSVAHLFEEKGYIVTRPSEIGEDVMLGKVMEVGGEDLTFQSEDEVRIYVRYDNLLRARNVLMEAGLSCRSYGSAMVPLFRVGLSSDDEIRFADLIRDLDGIEGVEAIYHNAEIP